MHIRGKTDASEHAHREGDERAEQHRAEIRVFGTDEQIQRDYYSINKGKSKEIQGDFSKKRAPAARKRGGKLPPEQDKSRRGEKDGEHRRHGEYRGDTAENAVPRGGYAVYLSPVLDQAGKQTGGGIDGREHEDEGRALGRVRSQGKHRRNAFAEFGGHAFEKKGKVHAEGVARHHEQQHERHGGKQEEKRPASRIQRDMAFPHEGKGFFYGGNDFFHAGSMRKESGN